MQRPLFLLALGLICLCVLGSTAHDGILAEAFSKEARPQVHREVEGAVEASTPVLPANTLATCDRERDSLALVALYNATNGQEWINPGGWLTDAPLEDWFGVTTDGDCVIGLQLRYNQLSGEISSQLGGLSNLTIIDFYGNQLNGPIPPELAQLSNLRILRLSFNDLIGAIPSEFGLLQDLVILDLDRNDLTGEIPIELTQLNNLSNLLLGSNRLHGIIPPQIGQLEKLSNLSLSYNDIRGEIPLELSQLDSLSSLFLTGNRLTGNIPTELGQLPNLTRLGLSENQLDGNIPIELSELEKLLVLGLSDNQLMGSIPPELSQLRLLKSLNLSNNILEGNIPSELSQLDSLSTLWLSGNQLVGPIPPELSLLNKLSRLNLSNNKLGGNIPPQFSQLSALEYFFCSNNNLEGNIPSQLGELTSLKYLRLSNNHLSGDIPPELSELNNLLVLYLNGNQLGGNVPSEFEQLTSLRAAYLHDNKLSGCIPSSLNSFCALGPGDTITSATIFIGFSLLNNPGLPFQGDFSRICAGEPQIGAPCNDSNPTTNNDTIDVDCNCTGELIVNTCNRQQDSLALVDLYNATNGIGWTNPTGWLTNAPLEEWNGITISEGCITRVALSRNNLIGTIPASLYDITSLELLSLGSNQISDTISTEIGKLVNLRSLCLEENQLSGPIPREIGRLANLTRLYLYQNSLTGNIPREIGQLTLLRRLRLFSNQLSGSIPKEVGLLNNLSVLWLGDNLLDNSIPKELGELEQVQDIDLSYNQLSGFIPKEIGELEQLKYINFSYNQLSGRIPEEITRARNLVRIRFGFNQLSDSIPVSIGDLVNLEDLWLNSNQLSGGIPEQIGNATNLISIVLSENRLTGSIPSSINRLVSLETIYLQNNQLSGDIPVELGQSDNLSRIYVHNNQLCGCFPMELTNICQLSPGPTSSPYTTGYSFQNNPALPYQGDFERICNGETQIGAPCDDGNPNTEDDRIQPDCTCGCPELVSAQIDTMLCMGDTLRFASEVITTESGRYELVLPTSLGGCDSLQVTWFVEVIGSETIMEQDTICEGTVLDWRSLDLRETGTYEFTETTVSGNCDTLFQLDLVVLARSDFAVADDTYELLSSSNAVELDLLSNDSLPYEYELSVIELPTKGTIDVSEETVLFTTDGASAGADSFRYEICLERCSDFCKQAWAKLDIEFNCELEIMTNTPGGFTPNGDGKNDVFDPLGSITGECLEQLGEVQMGIRNRQSELVFKTEGEYRAWDGTNRKGQALMADTYFYILEVAGLDKPISGAVDLVR